MPLYLPGPALLPIPTKGVLRLPLLPLNRYTPLHVRGLALMSGPQA